MGWFRPTGYGLPWPATFETVTNGVVSAHRLRTADQFTDVMSMRVPYGTWPRAPDRQQTRNEEFSQTSLSNWRTRSMPCTRADIAASNPFVAAKQVIMCQGVMVREWYSMRSLGRAGSCRTCTGCTR